MIDRSKAGKNIPVFGIPRSDPGYVYVVRNGDLFKIGRTTNPTKRLREAKTWVPEMQVIGVKPFWQHRRVERHLHEGFARAWVTHEWFRLPDEGYRDALLVEFPEFYDDGIDRNSIDFIYWFNSSGMSEFTKERADNGMTLPNFLKDETATVD